jgi:hypothetical protein
VVWVLIDDIDVSAYLPVTGPSFEIIDGASRFMHLERPDLIAAKIADRLAG